MANFLQYCRDGHYDNTIFHRVIDGFMIQGGGYAPGFEEKETRASIKNEAANGLSNKIGTIAMARTSEPHSASAQFFINVNNNDFLDFKSPPPRASATACSVKSPPAWTWSTRSRASRPATTAACIKTCRPKTSSSPR